MLKLETPKDSRSSLHKQTESWSFSRASRFPKIRVQGVTPFLPVPSTFVNHGAGMGYGKRFDFAQGLRHRQSPAPGIYTPQLQDKLRKIDFGYKYPFIDYGIPGPGHYKLEKPLGQTRPKYSFRGRLKLSLPKEESPSPLSYSPRKPSSTRFSKIGFGYGDRNFLSQLADTPGPGAYDPNRFKLN